MARKVGEEARLNPTDEVRPRPRTTGRSPPAPRLALTAKVRGATAALAAEIAANQDEWEPLEVSMGGRTVWRSPRVG